MDLSFCVVNTAGQTHLLRCLDSIRATLPAGLDAEILVLNNAPGDGSGEAVSGWIAGAGDLGERVRVIELDRRRGKAENDSALLKEATGEWCLLLNEDSELLPGCVDSLMAAVENEPEVAAAGAQLIGPEGSESACAWRLPGVGTALAQALFLHRIFVTQSGRGSEVKRVGWVQSAAMLVRREAAEAVGYLDPEFFVYSDETDFQRRLHDAGWDILHVPTARAVHHEQLTNDRTSGTRRAVEFHRNRDLYMRKHHWAAGAFVVRVLTAFNYAVRALLALGFPSQDAGWMWMHARLALNPQGNGIREAAAEFNAQLDRGEIVR